MPALMTQLLTNAVENCGSDSTSRQESSVGWNCRNGMKAPIRNVSDDVFTELTAAQTNGTRVKTAAAVSETWTSRRDQKLRSVSASCLQDG